MCFVFLTLLDLSYDGKYKKDDIWISMELGPHVDWYHVLTGGDQHPGGNCCLQHHRSVRMLVSTRMTMWHNNQEGHKLNANCHVNLIFDMGLYCCWLWCLSRRHSIVLTDLPCTTFFMHLLWHISIPCCTTQFVFYCCPNLTHQNEMVAVGVAATKIK